MMNAKKPPVPQIPIKNGEGASKTRMTSFHCSLAELTRSSALMFFKSSKDMLETCRVGGARRRGW